MTPALTIVMFDGQWPRPGTTCRWRRYITLDKTGARPDQVVFIGDAIWDVEAVFTDPAELLESTAGQLATVLPGSG